VTVEDVLKAIGREDIPVSEVVIRRPAVDEETGEYLAALEIEFPDEYPLAIDEERGLETLARSMGIRLKEKAP